MSFGEFLAGAVGAFISPESWLIWSAVLAAFVIIGTIAGSIAAGFKVAETIGWGWNFITTPAILATGAMVVLFLAWTAFGVNA